MSRYLVIAFGLCVASAAIGLAGRAHGQLPAFPGAEGAAKFVTGGRGGDVYAVDTLADYASGQPAIIGSLRHAVSSASGPRTIIFEVSGTIELARELQFNRSNMTIAGQTAPGGGITLAHRRTRIEADNVILQFMRFRAGDTNASTEPDTLWVTGSDGVIIDHVTASWSIDEGLSVTHESDNVTVQWSMITEALDETGHSNGPHHGYGSLLNGGDYTFHHNLYAQNYGRNPRPQGDTLRLDFVNNVIHNPGTRYGNSENNTQLGEGYELNYVGNYGIDGPDTTASALYQTANTPQSLVYASDNYRDSNDNGIFDGGPNSALAGGYTPLANRVALPEVATTDAPQAYVQVLSRAGASAYRDPVDRRIIRQVFNHIGKHLDSQNEVGGWPTLPAGTKPLDSNSDGVPDQWATDNGFTALTPLHQTFAPDGYTYLEKYVHSLTPYAYAPVGTVSHTISTAFGNGADAYVSENGGATAISSGNGTGNVLEAGWDGAGGALNQVMLLRFDLSELVPGSLTSARLDLTAAPGFAGNHSFKVYGLEHDAPNWDWDESAVEFNTAPALAVDNNSGSQGINTSYNASNPVDTPNLVALGTIVANSLADEQTVGLANPNLAVYLNLAAYFEGADQDGLVTLILQQMNDSGAAVATFYSSEGDALLAPRLVVDALLAPVVEQPLAGDFNNDGTVDAADYTVWRNALNGIGSLENETESIGTVDGEDYTAWKTNFGATGNPGGGALASVPEPASCIMLLLAGLAACGIRGQSTRRFARLCNS